MFKKFISLLVPIPLILNIQPVSSTTSPERKLIADAIKLYNSVTPEDSTKVRLTKRENFLKTIDQIIDQYSDTDTVNKARESRIIVVPDPTTANADDDFGFTTTIDFFEDSKKYNPSKDSDE